MVWLRLGCAWIVILLLASCGQQPAMPKTVFVTEHGLGPDKWATAWLLTRHAVPGARLVIAEADQPLPVGTVFDVPGASLQRKGNRSAFEVSLETYGLDDPDVEHLARIVNDIEVNFWTPNRTPEAALVEQAFRELQRGQAHGEVSPECYMAFFDSIHAALRLKRVEGVEFSSSMFVRDCDRHSLIGDQDERMVPEVPIPRLLSEMRRGKSVVFVDVREASEFREAHIPGALNITLRDLDEDIVERIKGADYVVAYCVKDFRGFEMAKALRDEGVENAVILQPYGMKGWLSQGLPMSGSMAMSDVDAKARLADCISSSGRCASETKSR